VNRDQLDVRGVGAKGIGVVALQKPWLQPEGVHLLLDVVLGIRLGDGQNLLRLRFSGC
jgi:hypothetical protein